jgi:flagellar basal-body rod protein FlgF/flagellar basal-body rod protein FlgG
VGIFKFADGTPLEAEGANRYISTVDSPPQSSTNALIHQGSIEGANEDVTQASLDLLMMQRQAEMMQKALTVFHTEFNKVASEDLPRIQG